MAFPALLSRAWTTLEGWRRRPYWRRVSESKVVIALVTAGSLFLAERKHLDSVGTASLDALLRISAPVDARHVVVVEVNEDDYRKRFRGTSPLDATGLRDVIAAVAAGRPAVIAIDIDTSPDSFQGLKPDPAWPRTVWAQDAIEVDGVFQPMAVLGGGALPSGASAGIALFPQDSGGVLRRYRGEFATAQGPAKSFVAAVVDAYGRPLSPREPGSDVVVRFSTLPYRVETYGCEYVMKASQFPQWPSKVGGRIVLLGGTYRAGRDEHLTPIGKKPGVHVLAQAIESDLRGTTVPSASRKMMAALQILLAMLVVFFYHRFGLTQATWASLAAVPLGSLASSYVAFGTLGLWPYFVPVVLAVLIHQLYERARSYVKTFEKAAGGAEAGPPSESSPGGAATAH